MTTAGTATEPLSWQREDTLGNHERLTAAALGGFAAASDLAACVVPLLSALGWRGNPRHVAEALPHFATTLDLTGLRNVMSNLGFTSRPERTALGDIDPRLMPCLYLPDGAGAMVLLESNEDGITVFNGETGTVDLLPWPRSRGVAYFFTLADDDLDGYRQRIQRIGWFRATMLRFRPLVLQGFGVSFLLALLSIAVPLFVMGVYDKVVGAGSLDTLTYFAAGVSVAMVLEVVLRGVRARILAFIGARMDYIIGGAILRHILYLAPSLYRERHGGLANRPHQGLRDRPRGVHRPGRGVAVRAALCHALHPCPVLARRLDRLCSADRVGGLRAAWGDVVSADPQPGCHRRQGGIATPGIPCRSTVENARAQVCWFRGRLASAVPRLFRQCRDGVVSHQPDIRPHPDPVANRHCRRRHRHHRLRRRSGPRRGDEHGRADRGDDPGLARARTVTGALPDDHPDRTGSQQHQTRSTV